MIRGYKIPLLKPVFQAQEPSNAKFSELERFNLRLEISKLHRIGAVLPCNDIPGQFISKIFLIPKTDNTYRFILNLKSFNKMVDTRHFKMEDFRTATRLLSPLCYMASIDLKDAYFLVGMHESSKKYLRFKFDLQTLEFQCLPFGLSSAPYIFTKILKPVVTFLRSKGLFIVNYLDDFLCLGKSYDDCLNCVSETINLLNFLGFVINAKKSKLVPSQCCKFLGFEFNSVDMTLSLPIEKRIKISDFVLNISKKKHIKIRDFAKFLGVLTSASPAVPYGWMYTKLFEREKFLALRESHDNYDDKMILNENLKVDFSWWEQHVMTSRNPIRSGQYSLEIFSDASMSGWGVMCNGERSHGFWDAAESQCHINLLELKAAYIGLKYFARAVTNAEILLRIDNTVAISYINRMGGIQYTHLNDITRDIWKWCEERRLFVFASYIKSKENVEADEESRRTNIDTEWDLSSMAFNKIVAYFGKPEVDLFASRLNTKCSSYVSWKRDPSAFNVDAFTIDWSSYYFYAFPPFSLILKSLRKIINDGAIGIMVVPYWKSQPWYPLFLSLACQDPVYLSPNEHLLLSPSREPHPRWRTLTLVSCQLSGRPSRNKTSNPKPLML